MKKQNVFMALFLAAFMLLLFGNVSSADPMMAPGTAVDISHCAQLEPTAARPACEAQAHGGPGPIDLVGVGPAAPVEPPMYGSPNDHHLPAPVGMDGDGPDCAGLPTPDEVAACWDTKNQHQNDHHNAPAFGDPAYHAPAPGTGATNAPECAPGTTCSGMLGSNEPMYGGPNDHHVSAPVGMDGDGPDCAGLPTPDEVAACWDTKNQHQNDHHNAPAFCPEGTTCGGPAGHHPPGMQGEDCAAMPTPTATADCWKRQNDPLLGAPAQ
jgi:predicted small lipoprotein YifL